MAAPAVVEKRVTKSGKTAKKAFRFAAKHDVLLFREVAAHNPFLTPSKWIDIAENLNLIGINVDARRCRERTTLQLEYFQKEDFDNLRKSGTEEEYEEKEQLLQEIGELKCDAASVKEASAQQKRKNDADSVAAHKIRRVAMQSLGSRSSPGMSPTTSPGTSPATTPGTSSPSPTEIDKKRSHMDGADVLEFLQSKNRREQDLREKELELQERRLALDEQRFEVEKEERLKLMELLVKKCS